MMALPVAVEPVNMTLSMSLWVLSSWPTSRPPATTCRTPSGSTWLMTWTRASTLNGVYSLGFITTVLPMRRAGASCQTLIIIGQFHGPMAPTTPNGR